MRTLGLTAVVMVFAGIGVRPSPALAAGTLDQSYTPPTGGLSATYLVSSDRYDFAQTFRVGLAGELERLELPVYRYSNQVTLPLRVEIRSAPGGAPLENDSVVLASATLPPSAFPSGFPFGSVSFVPIDLSAAHLPVVPGEELAIVLRSDEPFGVDRGYGWRSSGQGQNPYPFGTMFQRDRRSGGFFSPAGNGEQDIGFRTYVTVPEPGAAAALLVPAVVMVMKRRR
jgi:hypothetical protein